MIRTKSNCCPECDHPLNAATPISDNEKELISEGDVTVCAYCSTALQFDKSINLVKLSDTEIRQLPDDIQKYLFLATQLLAS